MTEGGKKQYKVRLVSGRILGPLDLDRIWIFIQKHQIVGKEIAREHPQGEWVDINAIPEIADLFVKQLEGTRSQYKTQTPNAQPKPLPGATKILSNTFSLGALDEKKFAQENLLPQDTNATKNLTTPELAANRSSIFSQRGSSAQGEEEDPNDKTLVVTPKQQEELKLSAKGDKNDTRASKDEDDKTMVASQQEKDAIFNKKNNENKDEPSQYGLISLEERSHHGMIDIANEQTIMLSKKNNESVFSAAVWQGFRSNKTKKSKKWKSSKLRTILVTALVIISGLQMMEEDEEAKFSKLKPIRPRLPALIQEKPNPELSKQYFAKAMQAYVQDTAIGYRVAVEYLQKSASVDMSNVRALAMLASGYLNLIDSSNKDENYFSVIFKLIDAARAKGQNIPEIVIADVEYYIVSGNPEAAENRIVNYTKGRENFGPEMFYYLAYAYHSRGELLRAAHFINQMQEKQIYSARIYYLRGLIAEGLEDYESALNEYKKAIQFNPQHARSQLKIASLMQKNGNLKLAKENLEFIMGKPNLLAPREQASAYYLYALFCELMGREDYALGAIERAVRLDKTNHDYIMELYTLRARAGEKGQKIQKIARMYYFLRDGEKMAREGKYHEAMTAFLQARTEIPEDPRPLIKIGDMHRNLLDLVNARISYQQAVERAPQDVEIWSKYINVLIQSYEWEDAKRAAERLQKSKMPLSTLDKLTADMYLKMGKHEDAQAYYKKAMSRDVIDPEVYIAYANSLIVTDLLAAKNCKEAPMFFSLALRFDPQNINAQVGIAKSVAACESIDKAILLLQDELQKSSLIKAELLTAIAEFQIRKGALTEAQENIQQAMSLNPDYAYPWKLMAQIHMSREGMEKGALEKALESYQSYSDRNPSDPSGYMERYKIFVRISRFDKAHGELAKVRGVFPKYPNLHFYTGALYSLEGNFNAAIQELAIELKNNEGNVPAMLELGKAHMEVGALDKALELFKKAMIIRPNDPLPKRMAGDANFKMKNYHGAIALYNAALTFDRMNPVLYRQRGLAYKALGDFAKANESFRKFYEMEPDADKQSPENYK